MLATPGPVRECMFFDVILPEFNLEARGDDPLSWFHFIEDDLNFDLLLYPKFACW
jgi:hypothetical protein